MHSDIQITEYGPMPSTFRSAKLSELCIDKIGIQTGPFGSQLHKEDYVEVGTPIITVEHLGDNRITSQNLPFVSDEDRDRLAKYRLEKGDIVFSRVGSVDRRALVRAEEHGWLFSGRCLRVRTDTTKIDPIYLSYFFGLESFKKYIRGIAVGATMPSINTKILSDVPIYYPEDLDAQRKIGEFFYTVDEKIQLNTQTNQTLEQIAQAIFKSWFVDFDPVRAKMAVLENGGTPEAALLAAMRTISAKDDASLEQMRREDPEAYARLEQTAVLFPSAMEENELGEIPEGWVWTPFGELLERTIGGDWGKEEPGSKHTQKVKILRGTDLPNVSMGNDGSVPTRYVEEKKLKTRKLQDSDIVIEVSGGSQKQPTGRSLYITDQILDRLDGVVEPASFCRMFRPKNKEIGLLLSIHLTYIYNEGKTWLYQNQSTGISNFQTKVFLENEYVVFPCDEFVQQFFVSIRPIIDKVTQSENKSLARIRDMLLPKLLSGDIPVGSMEKAL